MQFGVAIQSLRTGSNRSGYRLSPGADPNHWSTTKKVSSELNTIRMNLAPWVCNKAQGSDSGPRYHKTSRQRWTGHMQRKNLKNSARIKQPTAAFWGEGRAQRTCEKKIIAAFLVPFRESIMPSRNRFAEHLAQLEAENRDLRHRAVELALQIQALGDRSYDSEL
jgi:hypothetical protein